MIDNLGSAFRRTMKGFATGVAVVLASRDGEPIGATINSLTSVSLDPPLLLFCAQNDSRTADAVTRQGFFSVSLLAEAQEDISSHFAKKARSADITVCERHDKWFVVPDSNGVLLCEVARVYPAGDHRIIVGEVKEIVTAAESQPPLLYHAGRYNAMRLPQPAYL
jgi:3-hydroxy-9,10-secoandrosta-1,3,5(10)-triene-9,17-dione monooxygenase reductase component